MRRKIGIVGHEEAKFTPAGEQEARETIRGILQDEMSPENEVIVVSGGCHLGGIDIWAEEAADLLGLDKEIYYPATHSWDGGYKERNEQIAKASDVVFCLVVDKLPEGFGGMTHPSCYHCHTTNHVKSGGCWTAHKAKKLGKSAHWIVISND